MDECSTINMYTLCAVLNIHWRHGDNVPFVLLVSVHYSIACYCYSTNKPFSDDESGCMCHEIFYTSFKNLQAVRRMYDSG